MCGIFAVCHAKCSKAAAHYSLDEAKKRSKRQGHRGPDFDGYYQDARTGDILCHERLAIVDLYAHQPLQGTTPNSWVVHNGEIYNHVDLRENELRDIHMRSTCDSEVIIFLFEKMKSGMMCNMLDGIFAFALVHDDKFLAARDPLGIKQMYYGIDEDGRYMFCNEMKCIEDCCGQYELGVFPPGHYWTPEEGFVKYYTPKWTDFRNCIEALDLHHLRDSLIKSVHKRLMSDAPMGVLLSGGLDSSLISSIAAREMKHRGLAVHSFSIGIDANSPAVIAARKVADHIGTQHHEYYFTIEEGIKNLRTLIWHLETYDVTSIRASTPMYFLSEHIRKMGIKSVLSGEGADEIFGGYLYFHNAPTDEDFLKETIERVLNLNTSDCLRADKSSMAQSLEVRVPFLDKGFVEVAMLTAPQFKRAKKLENGRKCEKYALRQAFNPDILYDLSDNSARKDHPFLPDEILWRQKEQFSDGVGYNWIDKLMEYCAEQISDEEFAQAEKLFPINTPHSKEAYYMRKTFHELFPSDRAAMTVRKWIPKWQKNIDPSGRASTIHENTKEKHDTTQEKTDLARMMTTKTDIRSEQHA